jgi:hypothetical protein
MRNLIIAGILLACLAVPRPSHAAASAVFAPEGARPPSSAIQNVYWVCRYGRCWWRAPYYYRPYYRPYWRPYVRRCWRPYWGGPLRCY